MAKLTVPTPFEQDHTSAAADKIGSALSYRSDGALCLVAKGAHGRKLYPIVKAALEVVQGVTK